MKTLITGGLGQIGSHVAEQLARMGIQQLTLWDFDVVNAHNIPNQLYSHTDIGMLKVDALEKHLLEINPDIQIKKKARWDASMSLNGFIFMCVDKIDIRQQIVDMRSAEKNRLARVVSPKVRAGAIFSIKFSGVIT